MGSSVILNTLQDAGCLRILSGYHKNFVQRWSTENGFVCRTVGYDDQEIEFSWCVHDALKFLFDFGKHLCRHPDWRWKLELNDVCTAGDIFLIVYSTTEERYYGPQEVYNVNLAIVPF